MKIARKKMEMILRFMVTHRSSGKPVIRD